MKKNLLMGLVCPVMALTAVVAPVFAESPTSGSTKSTQVEYEVKADATGSFTTTEWIWEVPADQNFSDTKLNLQGTVRIAPANSDGSNKVLVLTNGTQIDVTLSSANNFALKNTDASAIPYQVKKGNTVLTNEAAGDKNHVLNFTAGTSTNTGVEQPLDFVTTPADLKAAKLTGAHTDTITFTVAVTPGT